MNSQPAITIQKMQELIMKRDITVDDRFEMMTLFKEQEARFKQQQALIQLMSLSIPIPMNQESVQTNQEPEWSEPEVIASGIVTPIVPVIPLTIVHDVPLVIPLTIVPDESITDPNGISTEMTEQFKDYLISPAKYSLVDGPCQIGKTNVMINFIILAHAFGYQVVSVSPNMKNIFRQNNDRISAALSDANIKFTTKVCDLPPDSNDTVLSIMFNTSKGNLQALHDLQTYSRRKMFCILDEGDLTTVTQLPEEKKSNSKSRLMLDSIPMDKGCFVTATGYDVLRNYQIKIDNVFRLRATEKYIDFEKVEWRELQDTLSKPETTESIQGMTIIDSIKDANSRRTKYEEFILVLVATKTKIKEQEQQSIELSQCFPDQAHFTYNSDGYYVYIPHVKRNAFRERMKLYFPKEKDGIIILKSSVKLEKLLDNLILCGIWDATCCAREMVGRGITVKPSKEFMNIPYHLSLIYDSNSMHMSGLMQGYGRLQGYDRISSTLYTTRILYEAVTNVLREHENLCTLMAESPERHSQELMAETESECWYPTGMATQSSRHYFNDKPPIKKQCIEPKKKSVDMVKMIAKWMKPTNIGPIARVFRLFVTAYQHGTKVAQTVIKEKKKNEGWTVDFRNLGTKDQRGNYNHYYRFNVKEQNYHLTEQAKEILTREHGIIPTTVTILP